MARRALLVGIGNYQGSDFDSLQAPPKDAASVAQLLIESEESQHSWTCEVIPHPDKGLTSKELWDAVQDFLSDHGGADDLLFYFAGHGATPLATGRLATSDMRGGLGGLPMPDLMSLVRQHSAHIRSLTIILDCCSSGRIHEATAGLPLPQNVSVMTASYRDREAYEVGHSSVFTSALRDGLEVAVEGVFGHITVTSLYNHIHEHLSADGFQQPTFHGYFTDVPVLRSVKPKITKSDTARLLTIFTSATDPSANSPQSIRLTRAHEGPNMDGKERDEIGGSVNLTQQQVEFDFLRELQKAGLVATDAKDGALYFAARPPEGCEHESVYLTHAGRVVWDEARRKAKNLRKLGIRGGNPQGTTR